MLSTAVDDERLFEWAREDNARDLRRCRELLVELDEDDLRSRLSAGTWNARHGSQQSQREMDMQSGKILDDRWLQEAAAAFQVATTYTKVTCTEDGAASYV